MEKDLEDNQPNYKLGNIALALFYKTGKIGYWNFAMIMNAPEKEFNKIYPDFENEQNDSASGKAHKNREQNDSMSK